MSVREDLKDKFEGSITLADIRLRVAAESKVRASQALAQQAVEQMNMAHQAARSGLYEDAAFHCRMAASSWDALDQNEGRNV